MTFAPKLALNSEGLSSPKYSRAPSKPNIAPDAPTPAFGENMKLNMFPNIPAHNGICFNISVSYKRPAAELRSVDNILIGFGYCDGRRIAIADILIRMLYVFQPPGEIGILGHYA